MLLWIVFAILTTAAALAVVKPFWENRSKTQESGQDAAVYKQQLAELEDERARGVIGESEAESARVEISRRLLRATEQADAAGARTTPSFAPYALIGLIAAGSMGVYLYFGSPNLPDRPLSARTAPQQQEQSVEGLVARVEERLKTHPDDGMGWSVVANVYMRMGRYNEAAKAYRKTIELLGPTTERWSAHGEALTLANNGNVTPEASQSFEKALASDSTNVRAQFWLAAEKEQQGNLAEAARRYRTLIDGELPQQVKTMLSQRLAAVEARQSGAPEAIGANPEQAAMIESMVSGLADRLQEDGSDLEGWLKLMRAYTVLGRRDNALDAWKQAQSNFADNDQALTKINSFAKSLGLQS